MIDNKVRTVTHPLRNINLSLITLLADMESCEGDIIISDEFERLDGLAKADLLSDWIGVLQQEYDQVNIFETYDNQRK